MGAGVGGGMVGSGAGKGEEEEIVSLLSQEVNEFRKKNSERMLDLTIFIPHGFVLFFFFFFFWCVLLS